MASRGQLQGQASVEMRIGVSYVLARECSVSVLEWGCCVLVAAAKVAGHSPGLLCYPPHMGLAALIVALVTLLSGCLCSWCCGGFHKPVDLQLTVG